MVMEIQMVPLLDIRVSNNRRNLSQKSVDALMGSILEIGLQNPIGLTRDYRLIHGAHRLAAYRELQRDTIPAIIHDLDELHAELAEIDENIQRKQLTKAQECKAVARRKELYLALHPETKRGTAGGKASGESRGGNKRTTENISFVQDTADKTGKSERSIELDVAIGTGLSEKLVDAIKDTKVANNKRELKKLSKLEPDMQTTVAKMLKEGEVATVTEALTSHDEVEEECEEVNSASILCERLDRIVTKWVKEFDETYAVAASITENFAERIRNKRRRK